jgi:hypothetical protein
MGRVPPEERISRQAEDSEYNRLAHASPSSSPQHLQQQAPRSARFHHSHQSLPPSIQQKTEKTTTKELAHRLAMVANERCRAELDAYNACSAGRSMSVVWACREAYRVSNACIRR